MGTERNVSLMSARVTAGGIDVRFRLLGTAAGGSSPQWNCACDMCRGLREGTIAGSARMQNGAAFSPDGKDWYLINATPDVRHQIESFDALHPGPGLRDTPIKGVLLTDAELDHTIGLLSLREGSDLTIYSTDVVRDALHGKFPVTSILERYCTVRWQCFDRESPVVFGEGAHRIEVRVVPFEGDAPRYAGPSAPSGDWVNGLLFTNGATGRTLGYFPGVPRLTPALARLLEDTDYVFFDGTFWTNDELSGTGAVSRTALDMGHVPISGEGGSALWLKGLSRPRKYYVHINNTNPILDESSEQFRWLKEHGLEVGRDGLEVTL